MPLPTQNLSWTECLGRNGWDQPLAIPDNMGQEAVNVTLRNNQLCAKRPGSAAVTLTGDSFNGYNGLFKFIPAQDETLAELWIVSQDGTTKILRVPVAAAINLTLKDNVSGNPKIITAAGLNGKFFLAYQSGINRLHVYAPNESTTGIRRSGLPATAGPAVIDDGSGTYPATPRWYAIAWQRVVSGVVVSQSNMSLGVAFTPSGSGAHAQVEIQPTGGPSAPGEGETHWVIYASAQSANGPFYQLVQLAVGTSFYEDAANPLSYSLNALAPLQGSNYPFPSVKFLVSDGARLLGLGVWETSGGDSVAPVPGRVYFTPVLGSTSPPTGDDERFQNTINQSDWISLNVNGGGIDRGLSGPLNNIVYAFQSKGVYALIATASAQTPYRRFVISRTHGSVSQQSQVIAEDAAGSPALYFLSPIDGPRRILLGSSMQWIGKDVTDLWKRVNQSVLPFGVFDYVNKQVLWWVAVDGSSTLNAMLCYNVTLGVFDGTSTRRGWSQWNGPLANAVCGVMFPSTLAASRPVLEVPYRGDASILARQDGTSNQDFGSVSYQGFVRSNMWNLTSMLRKERMVESWLTALTQAATSIRATFTKNFGAETATADASIAPPTGPEVLVRARLDETNFGDLDAIDVTLGDAAAANSTFTLVRFDSTAEIEVNAR